LIVDCEANVKKKLEPRFKFVCICAKDLACVSIITQAVGAKKTLSEVLAKTAHGV